MFGSFFVDIIFLRWRNNFFYNYFKNGVVLSLPIFLCLEHVSAQLDGLQKQKAVPKRIEVEKVTNQRATGSWKTAPKHREPEPQTLRAKDY